MRGLYACALGLVMALGPLSHPGAAAAVEGGPCLALELNRVDPVQGACRLTFLAENALGADIAALALETVLIDTEGRVERLTLFEFGNLPDGTPRVRQFDVAGLSCEALGQVLVNGIATCTVAADCAAALHLSTRTEVEVIG